MSTVVQDCILHLNTSSLNFYTVVIFVVRLCILKKKKKDATWLNLWHQLHMWSFPPYRCTLCMFCILQLIQKHLYRRGHIWTAVPAERTDYWTLILPSLKQQVMMLWDPGEFVHCFKLAQVASCSVQISRAPVPPYLSMVRESSFMCFTVIWSTNYTDNKSGVLSSLTILYDMKGKCT